VKRLVQLERKACHSGQRTMSQQQQVHREGNHAGTE
jgi:hypothetical protein